MCAHPPHWLDDGICIAPPVSAYSSTLHKPPSLLLLRTALRISSFHYPTTTMQTSFETRVMDSSSAVSPMDSPYHGQDLSRGEIRLLTVVSTEPGLELSTERHSLAEDLEFEAVSYVWGTAPATVEAICNGKPLLVTPTIRDMLEHLHLYRLAPQRPLWIDAICINQYDMDEKAIQIPSMHNVFFASSPSQHLDGHCDSGHGCLYGRISQGVRHRQKLGIYWN